jgi:hypothetical protein
MRWCSEAIGLGRQGNKLWIKRKGVTGKLQIIAIRDRLSVDSPTRARRAEPRGSTMRDCRRRPKASKKRSRPAVPLGTVRDEQHAVVAEDTGAISASPEANNFAQGNTGGGRHPPYKPEYAERAKAMCDRGATLDELAEVFEVPPKTIRFWTISNSDFYEACKVTPGCVERAKRNILISLWDKKNRHG